MSDHTVVLTVVLDKDYRVDDAECIMSALRMVKGVLSVEAIVSDIGTYTAYSRARMDLENKLWSALRDEERRQISVV